MDKNSFEIENNIDNMSQNEIDPKLRFDAFTAGMQDGGLRSVSSISLIVCYIIANINGRVTAENITQTMDEGMFANHFEVADAISKLKKSGVITESEDGALSLINVSKANIELIEMDLPLTVRENSIKLCQKIIAKENYKRENRVEIIEKDKGYIVNLNVSDKETDFLSLNLFASTKEQAEMIKEKFISNPIKVYETLIDAIFDNK
ncbi:MAG: DUF4364 family protein [Ruminococcaceae bacterium]|nr:DUF4364 family protein [Oscillospiraceae bacterium]